MVVLRGQVPGQQVLPVSRYYCTIVPGPAAEPGLCLHTSHFIMISRFVLAAGKNLQHSTRRNRPGLHAVTAVQAALKDNPAAAYYCSSAMFLAEEESSPSVSVFSILVKNFNLWDCHRLCCIVHCLDLSHVLCWHILHQSASSAQRYVLFQSSESPIPSQNLVVVAADHDGDTHFNYDCQCFQSACCIYQQACLCRFLVALNTLCLPPDTQPS